MIMYWTLNVQLHGSVSNKRVRGMSSVLNIKHKLNNKVNMKPYTKVI